MSAAGGRLGVSAHTWEGATACPHRQRGVKAGRRPATLGILRKELGVVDVPPEDQDSSYSKVYTLQAPGRSSNKHRVDLELSILPLLTNLFYLDLAFLDHHLVYPSCEGLLSLHLGPPPTSSEVKGAVQMALDSPTWRTGSCGLASTARQLLISLLPSSLASSFYGEMVSKNSYHLLASSSLSCFSL